MLGAMSGMIFLVSFPFFLIAVDFGFCQCSRNREYRTKLLLFDSRKLNVIILKKVGKIGGDDQKVRSRIKHILSCIDRSIRFEITEVKVRGSVSGSRPPIYEVFLSDEEPAEALRRAFSRYTRKKNPLRCPPELDGVEVCNSVTLATRVRISVLRVSFASCDLFRFYRMGFVCHYFDI